MEIVLNFPGYHRWRFSNVLRNILKLLISIAWVIILPALYLNSFKMTVNLPFKDLTNWLNQVKGGGSPLYFLAIFVYLLPNVLTVVLFIFPMLRRWIENSDWHVIRLLLWWSQVLSIFLQLSIFSSFFGNEY